jgi:hypothetical protein
MLCWKHPVCIACPADEEFQYCSGRFERHEGPGAFAGGTAPIAGGINLAFP